MRYSVAISVPFFVTIAGTVAMAEETWAVLPEEASCLLENVEAYRQASSEPIVIFMKVCPVVDRMEALQALQQNSGSLPSVTVEPTEDGVQPLDEVIVYTAAELECLKSLSLDFSVTPVLLPQTPCDP